MFHGGGTGLDLCVCGPGVPEGRGTLLTAINKTGEVLLLTFMWTKPDVFIVCSEWYSPIRPLSAHGA